YDGTVLLVSHDRAFLDGVATQIVAPLGDGRWVESPGGWGDFERAYPQVLAPKQAPRVKEAKGRDREAVQPSKLSFKHERRAAELETLLPRLQAEIATLEARLSDQSTFATDSAAFTTAAERLAAARAEQEAAEAEWFEIELMREKLAPRN